MADEITEAQIAAGIEASYQTHADRAATVRAIHTAMSAAKPVEGDAVERELRGVVILPIPTAK